MKKEGDRTPQTFIDGQRIGGHEELKVYFEKKKPSGRRRDEHSE